MNNTNIFKKSKLGHAEIKNTHFNRLFLSQKKPSIDGFKFHIRDNSINYDCFQEGRLPYLACSIICLSTPKALVAQRMK